MFGDNDKVNFEVWGVILNVFYEEIQNKLKNIYFWIYFLSI